MAKSCRAIVDWELSQRQPHNVRATWIFLHHSGDLCAHHTRYLLKAGGGFSAAMYGRAVGGLGARLHPHKIRALPFHRGSDTLANHVGGLLQGIGS